MLHPDAGDALLTHPAFQDLPAHLNAAVLAEAKRVQLQAGQPLFDFGSPCHSFPIVLKGSIRVVKVGASGREILLYRLRAGDTCILTVTCLLAGETYAARSIAEADVTALLLPGPVFRRLMVDSAAFREFVFRFISQRVVALMQRIEEMAFSGLDQRVAAALLAHCNPVQITHQRLADELGSVREVISRILKDLEARGLLRLERGQIHVLDRAGLVQLANPVGDGSH